MFQLEFNRMPIECICAVRGVLNTRGRVFIEYGVKSAMSNAATFVDFKSNLMNVQSIATRDVVGASVVIIGSAQC
jgi:hypothetical protein